MQIAILSTLRQTSTTPLGKVICFLWVTIIILFMTACATFIHSVEYGLFFIASWFYLAGIIIIIAILLSYKGRNDWLRLSKFFWIAVYAVLQVTLIIFVITNYDVDSSHEFGILLAFGFLFPAIILSFPSGLVGVILVIFLGLVIQGFYDLVGINNIAFQESTGYLLVGQTLSIFTIAALGYYQWFVLIPSIIEKRKCAKNQGEKE